MVLVQYLLHHNICLHGTYFWFWGRTPPIVPVWYITVSAMYMKLLESGTEPVQKILKMFLINHIIMSPPPTTTNSFPIMLQMGLHHWMARFRHPALSQVNYCRRLTRDTLQQMFGDHVAFCPSSLDYVFLQWSDSWLTRIAASCWSSVSQQASQEKHTSWGEARRTRWSAVKGTSSLSLHQRSSVSQHLQAISSWFSKPSSETC